MGVRSSASILQELCTSMQTLLSSMIRCQPVSLYHNLRHRTYIVLFSVDAHVGKSLFNDAILGYLRAHGKTVILVTHALHFLSQCDYIYTIANGKIAEHGEFATLLARNGEFARLSREFGGEQKKEDEVEQEVEAVEEASNDNDKEANMSHYLGDSERQELKRKLLLNKAAGKGNLEGRLMVKEQRTTGSVPGYGKIEHISRISHTHGLCFAVYASYVKAGMGWITVPCILVAMILMQGCSVMNSYTLVWWEAKSVISPTFFCSNNLM